MNCATTVFTDAEGEWATLTAVPDSSVLGKRLGKDLKAVSNAVKALSHAAVRDFMSSGSLAIPLDGGATITLTLADVKIIRDVKADKIAAGFETLVSPDGSMLVAINTVQDESLRGLGATREVVNRVQKLRKKLRLQVRRVSPPRAPRRRGVGGAR